MKRFFLDTEFIEAPGILELISVALVCEDGRELYEVSSDFDPAQANEFVRLHVLPKLPPRETWIPKAEIARRVRTFIGDDVPEVWAYFADYDWVVFCWLFGDMMSLPKGWPCFCLDLRQSMWERGIVRESLPPDPKNAHDALEDARWLREAHQIIYGGART